MNVEFKGPYQRFYLVFYLINPLNTASIINICILNICCSNVLLFLSSGSPSHLGDQSEMVHDPYEFLQSPEHGSTANSWSFTQTAFKPVHGSWYINFGGNWKCRAVLTANSNCINCISCFIVFFMNCNFWKINVLQNGTIAFLVLVHVWHQVVNRCKQCMT